MFQQNRLTALPSSEMSAIAMSPTRGYENDSVEYVKTLGEGGFANVYEMIDSNSSRRFARKLYHSSFASEYKKSIVSEIQAIRLGEHPNLIRILDFGFTYDSRFFIDMEICDITLKDWIYTEEPWPSEIIDSLFLIVENISHSHRVWQLYCIISQIVRGVGHIHKHKLVHRDLKPSNVVYSRTNQCWKLIDFDSASIAAHKTQYSTSACRGTSGYRAPELLHEDGKYSSGTDVWALGCILYELRARKKLFRDDIRTRDWAVSKERLEIALSDELCILENEENEKLLICQMLDRKWQKRPSAAGVEKKIESAHTARCFAGGSGLSICA